MEWFAGPKGLYFSEIGCRPPGVRCWDLYAAGNDLDIYLEWAMAVVHGRVTTAPSRRFAAGMVALRPDRDGAITHYDGVDEVQQRYRGVGDRRPPAARRHADPAGRGRVHGQRLGAHASPRLRRPARACSTTWAGPSRSTRDERALPHVERVPATCTVEDPRGPPGRRRSVPRSSSPAPARSPTPVRSRRCASPTSASACPTTWPSSRSTSRAGGCWPLDVPHGSRLEYKLEVVDSWGQHLVEDPLNPNVAHHPFGANSVCEAWGYEPPLWVRHADDVPTGHVPRGRAVERGLRPAGDSDGVRRRRARRRGEGPAAGRARRRRLPAVRVGGDGARQPDPRGRDPADRRRVRPARRASRRVRRRPSPRRRS